MTEPVNFFNVPNLGRVLRPAPGQKKATLYDYVERVGGLRNAARAEAG